MKIPHYLNQPRATSETPASSVGRGARPEQAGNGSSTPASAKGDGYSVAPEIVELTSRLRELPEVREEVIARVKGQLQTGEYLTRGTAEQLADGLLGDAN